MTLALRAWLRYLVPLTLLAAVALAPLLYVALVTSPPANVEGARALVRRGWVLASCAVVFQLLLVAAAAPLVASVAAARPLSQLRSLLVAARSLLRGVMPWLVATFAIVLGGLALVVPGLLVLVLVSLTGASEHLDRPRDAVLDSIAIVRTAFARIALVVVLIVLADLAIAYVAQRMYVPMLAKKMAATKLVTMQAYVRAVAVGLVAISPLVACVLAAIRSNAERR
jgi:hypothetical protein